ncbi:MAG TPA: YbaB/EbfC family nucleoid-associated protein [Actinophytocola sp.]|uniref:YbaB/EbfC family nucleoid-associated protein n=1 Tax=Actinophytocola sp. TaxID=1872138 RepID=UPI002DB81C15|nr:YbaB/EbfC family nucleoid-associated protein [Actinophytocola sp.]HEU5470967.1 YbaB/EbfC family nucleoid-associated protein [Actinophytocola sp.]
MEGTILDPDGAREHLAEWKGRIDKMAADTEAMRQRLQDLRVSASDPNGLAEVSVDSTGALVGLRLTERIGNVAPDVVARAIMTTLGEARGRLADQSKEIIAETVGTESPAARAIAESVDKHLRRDFDEEDAAPPAPRNQGRADGVDDDEDGDYDVFSTFRR